MKSVNKAIWAWLIRGGGGEPGSEGDGNSLREAGEEMAGSGISKATGTKRKGEN